ncbi:MAG: hypothetical protein IJ566_04125 [Cardiobacteriaceae bacterium]|nr:hypothetical protein [Cardiobacteriaceae bacterium]
MSDYNFLVAPDFAAAHIPAWYQFNHLLQKLTGEAIHLHVASDFDDYYQHLTKQPSLVYAGPFDTVQLYRKFSYQPLLRPTFVSDEVTIFANKNAAISHINQVDSSFSIACMRDYYVERISLILMEPSNLGKKDINWNSLDYVQTIIRQVYNDRSVLGCIRSNIFNELAPNLKDHFEPIIKSSLYVLFHTLLCSPACEQLHASIQSKVNMLNSFTDVINDLGVPRGFKVMNNVHANFFCDMMDTLN